MQIGSEGRQHARGPLVNLWCSAQPPPLSSRNSLNPPTGTLTHRLTPALGPGSGTCPGPRTSLHHFGMISQPMVGLGHEALHLLLGL